MGRLERFENFQIKVNNSLNRIMAFVPIFGMILGLVFRDFFSNLAHISTWLFAFITFCGALSMNFSSFLRIFTHPKSFATILFGNHIIMPLLGYFIGKIFFAGTPDLTTGFVLTASIPIAIVTLIWTDTLKGNQVLGISLILVDTVLSPFLTPLTLKILVGSEVEMDVSGMMLSLLYMVAIPALLGAAVNQFFGAKVANHINNCTKAINKPILMLVVASNIATISGTLLNPTEEFVIIIVFVIIFAALGFVVGIVITRLFRFSREDAIPAILADSLKNTSAGLVIATAYFSPLAALPTTFMIVLQQVVLGLIGVRMINKAFPEQSGESTQGQEAR